MAFLAQSVRKFGAWTAAVAVSAAVLTGGAHEARAEGPVVGTGKGIAGGALLGGEAVALGMAAFGVSKGWTYLVFPTLGMVGGGVGGYFVEKAAPSGVPVAMLAGGMALVIPTLIVTLNATVYRAPENYPNEPVTNQPSPETPTPGAPRARRDATHRIAELRPRPVPMSLVDIHQGRLAFGVPAVDVRPMYTQQEIAQFGVRQGTQVNVPVFRAVF
jgi:hypothetical protein